MAYTAIDNSQSVIQHYGKLVDAKVNSRMNRAAAWKARANKVNKMSSLTTKPQI